MHDHWFLLLSGHQILDPNFEAQLLHIWWSFKLRFMVKVAIFNGIFMLASRFATLKISWKRAISAPTQKCKRSDEDKKFSMLPGNPKKLRIWFWHDAFASFQVDQQNRAETETMAFAGRKVGSAGPSLHFLKHVNDWRFLSMGSSHFLCHIYAICVSFRWVLAGASLLGIGDASLQSREFLHKRHFSARMAKSPPKKHILANKLSMTVGKQRSFSSIFVGPETTGRNCRVAQSCFLLIVKVIFKFSKVF